jgi:deoxyribodipyrimidine photo-lyase
MSKAPVILWLRRDLRLGDHPALTAACDSGRPVIPVYIHDDLVSGLGAAQKLRLELALAHFDKVLRDKGSRLILRKGRALDVLRDLVKETGADHVYWSRQYYKPANDRDTDVKSALKDDGLTVKSYPGHLLFEPWTVETKTGGFYKVYTPMWKAVRGTDIAEPLPRPSRIAAPDNWPKSDDLADWHLRAAMRRGADTLASHCTVGEDAATSRLGQFIAHKVANYATNRDLPGVKGTSGLSENLTFGEISPRICWHAGKRALRDGKSDAEVFLKELVWREFAYHLAHHTPRILTDNWKEDWDAFPWQTKLTAEVQAWQQGRTGIPFVDAAMREMYVTGTMHNRGRMIVASYLTKHLLAHWKIGLDWFADCLIDWDPASNAMGWQWSAGSGPDATPYFRVFNPVTQADKFDKDRAYVDAWIAEGRKNPKPSALAYFDMVPKAWDLSPDAAYPDPVVSADQGRKRALDAYEGRGF